MSLARLALVFALTGGACDSGRPVTPGTPGTPRADTGTSSTADGGVTTPRDAGVADGSSTDASVRLDANVGPMDAAAPRPPSGAYLYVGAGGGGPSSDLHVESVASILATAGLAVAIGATPPTDFLTQFGLLALMNPRDPVPSDVTALAAQVLAAGGRVLLIMEHCKNGCWGNAPGDNAFITALGGDMVLSGMGGSPLSNTSLSLTPVGAITRDISDLVVFYSGSVDVGTGTALGRVPGGDVVIGHQRIGAGELIVVADSSMFGHVLEAGDNRQFIVNLATF